MSSKSHAQKRKEKLKKRAQKQARRDRRASSVKMETLQPFLAVSAMMYTYVAIASVWHDRRDDSGMCDDDLTAALNTLIQRLRARTELLPDPCPSDSRPEDVVRSNADEFVEKILRMWIAASEDEGLPGVEVLIDILEELLEHVEVYRKQGAGSTAYLQSLISSQSPPALRGVQILPPTSEELEEYDLDDLQLPHNRSA